MTEETSDEATSLQPALCRLCRQQIPSSAKVCHHCSRDQRWLARHFPIAVCLSIALLAVATWQLLAATDTLQQAREVRESTHLLALSSAEILLATLAVDKGRYMDFKSKTLTAPYVRRRIDRMFDALHLTQPERAEHLKVYRAYVRWEQASEGSPTREQAWQELAQLLGDGSA